VFKPDHESPPGKSPFDPDTPNRNFVLTSAFSFFVSFFFFYSPFFFVEVLVYHHRKKPLVQSCRFVSHICFFVFRFSSLPHSSSLRIGSGVSPVPLDVFLPRFFSKRRRSFPTFEPTAVWWISARGFRTGFRPRAPRPCSVFRGFFYSPFPSFLVQKSFFFFFL